MMVDHKNYIAVGLLTQADLDRLGAGFRAAIPVEDISMFDDLLQAIDDAERHVQQGYRSLEG